MGRSTTSSSFLWGQAQILPIHWGDDAFDIASLDRHLDLLFCLRVPSSHGQLSHLVSNLKSRLKTNQRLAPLQNVSWPVDITGRPIMKITSRLVPARILPWSTRSQGRAFHQKADGKLVVHQQVRDLLLFLNVALVVVLVEFEFELRRFFALRSQCCLPTLSRYRNLSC